MNSSRKKTFAFCALGITVALNIGIVLWRLLAQSQIPPGPRQDLINRQTERVAAWASRPTIPATSVSQWTDAMRVTPDDGCLRVPVGATPVSKSDVSAAQRDSFHAAVAGLLRVYVENSPQAMLLYMKEHGQRPIPERIEEMRATLAKARHVSIAALRSLSSEAVYRDFWREAGVHAHIQAIVEDAGCHQFWRYNGPLAPAIKKSLGQSEGRLFQNVVRITPAFESIDSLDHGLQTEGSVLYGDAKVVVQLDGSFFGQLVPWFFRFRYAPAEKRWHPCQLVCVRTISRRGPNPRLLF